jgi:hypothetical protein
MSYISGGYSYPGIAPTFSLPGFDNSALTAANAITNSLYSSTLTQSPQYSNPFSTGLFSGYPQQSQGMGDLWTQLTNMMATMFQNLGQQSLGNGLTNPTNTSQNTYVDYSDKKSIQNRMAQITGKDPKVKDLYTKWTKADPNSTDAGKLSEQVVSAMKEAGYSNPEIQDYLYLQNYLQTGVFPADKPKFEDKNPIKVDYKNQKSIQSRATQLAGKNSQVNSLYSQWKKADPDSANAQQLRAKLSTAMQNANYPDKTVQEFFKLLTKMDK